MNKPMEIEFRAAYFQLIFKNCNDIMSKHNDLKFTMASEKELTTSRERPMKQIAV